MAAPFDYIGAANSAISLFNSVFAPQQQRRNMEYQQQLALQNWRIQQEYNSPLNQKKRLLDAGINPNVAFAGTQTSSGSAPAPPETAPFGQLTPSAAWSQQFLNNSASNIAALAQAAKSGAESKSILSLLNSEIKKMDLQNISQDIQNQLNDFNLQLQKVYGHRRMSADTEKAVADYYNILQQISNAAKSGQILDSQVYQAAVDKLIKDLEKQGKEVEVKMLQERAKQLPALLTAEVNEVNSRVNANNASAESSRASAESTRTDTEFAKQTADIRKKLLSHQETRQLFENSELAEDLLQILAEHSWNLEYLWQSENMPGPIRSIVGYLRTIVHQGTIPLKDLLRGVLKK